MEEELKKLREFKQYVHKRLDDACIEKEPNGEHSKHGCRIGDRLDIALGVYRWRESYNDKQSSTKLETNNLRCLIEGRSLSLYQRSLAIGEWNKIVNLLDKLDAI